MGLYLSRFTVQYCQGGQVLSLHVSSTMLGGDRGLVPYDKQRLGKDVYMRELQYKHLMIGKEDNPFENCAYHV